MNYYDEQAGNPEGLPSQPASTEGNHNSMPPKKHRKGLIIGLIAAALILIAVIIAAVLILSNRNGENAGTPDGESVWDEAEELYGLKPSSYYCVKGNGYYYCPTDKGCILIEDDGYSNVDIAPGGTYILAQKTTRNGNILRVFDRNGKDYEEITTSGSYLPGYQLKKSGFEYEQDALSPHSVRYFYDAKAKKTTCLGNSDDLICVAAPDEMTFLCSNKVKKELTIQRGSLSKPEKLDFDIEADTVWPIGISNSGNLAVWAEQTGPVDPSGENEVFLVENGEKISLGIVRDAYSAQFSKDEQCTLIKCNDTVIIKEVGKDPLRFQLGQGGFLFLYTENGSFSENINTDFEHFYVLASGNLSHFDKAGNETVLCNLGSGEHISFDGHNLFYLEDNCIMYVKIDGAAAEEPVKIASDVKNLLYSHYCTGYVNYVGNDHKIYYYEPGDSESRLVYSGFHPLLDGNENQDLPVAQDPNGEYIYFLKELDQETGGTLIRLNIRTGEAETLDENVTSNGFITGYPYSLVIKGFSYWKYDSESDNYTYCYYKDGKITATEIVREKPQKHK